MNILLLLCALSLSGVAAFYSIFGLMAIFAASPVPIAVMGSILEVSKLVVASWLYRNWKQVPILMKSYFTMALMVLMFLTSMGIFGFLSKAHLDQNVPTGDVVARIELFDDKIKTERENINGYRKSLDQMDQQVNKYSEVGAVSKGIAARKDQQQERTALITSIESSQEAITRLNEEKLQEASTLRKAENEVGPVKYIAALIYGDDAGQDLLEKSVRWVILLIVSVFDPLAVIMLIAASWSLQDVKKIKNPVVLQAKVEQTQTVPVFEESFKENEPGSKRWRIYNRPTKG